MSSGWAMMTMLVGAPDMLHGTFIALMVIIGLLAWLMIVVPAIARCFRAPYKFGTLPFASRNQSLSRWQSFWFAGVLGWGGTVFAVSASLAYFSDVEHFSKLTVYQLLFRLVVFLISGGLLSLWITSRHNGKHTKAV